MIDVVTNTTQAAPTPSSRPQALKLLWVVPFHVFPNPPWIIFYLVCKYFCYTLQSDLNSAFESLHVDGIEDWYYIGLLLGIGDDELNKITVKLQNKSSHRKLVEVLSSWLSSDSISTHHALINAKRSAMREKVESALDLSHWHFTVSIIFLYTSRITMYTCISCDIFLILLYHVLTKRCCVLRVSQNFSAMCTCKHCGHEDAFWV